LATGNNLQTKSFGHCPAPLTLFFSLFYLLQFWSRLSCAVSLSRRDDTDELQIYISSVFSSLCDSLMTELPKIMGGRDCDPCDGLETLLDHVETVQTMSRVKYDATAFTICQRMDAQLDLLQAVAATGNFTPAAMAAEGCLAWLTYFVSTIIQGRRPPEEDERFDAELTLRVFRVMQWLEVREQRLPQAPVGVKVLERLELAVLNFLAGFRRTYVGDQPTASCVTLFKGACDHYACLTNHFIFVPFAFCLMFCNSSE
jgi:hypothetical protein